MKNLQISEQKQREGIYPDLIQLNWSKIVAFRAHLKFPQKDHSARHLIVTSDLHHSTVMNTLGVMERTQMVLPAIFIIKLRLNQIYRWIQRRARNFYQSRVQSAVHRHIISKSTGENRQSDF